MNEDNRSTLEFRSNLQPLTKGWNNVYKSIRDPFALTQMVKKGLQLTPAQDKEYKYASLHCAYAFTDDYPWGTIRTEDGKEKVVCKCLNVNCGGFKQCRPDFNPEELLIFEDNIKMLDKSVEFSVHLQDLTEISTEEETIPDTLEEQISDPEPIIADEIVPDNQSEDLLDIHELTDDNFSIPLPESVPDNLEDEPEEIPEEIAKPEETGFSSFVETSQQSIIDSDTSAKAVINAGPGTGKTFTLIEKLIHMAKAEDTDPSTIMVLCFSRAAVEVIEQRLKSAFENGKIGYDYIKIEVRTFDSFCTSMIYWAIENYPDALREDYHIEYEDYDARIATAITVIQKVPDIFSQYRHVIVDEVQDLVGCRAELVLNMLDSLPGECGFTLLGDACQALYDWQASAHPEIMSSDDFYKKIFSKWPDISYLTFKENHRQTGALSALAVPYRNAILTGSETERNRIVDQIMSKIRDSGIDLHKIDGNSFRAYSKEGSIGILTRTNGQALKISELLRNADIEHTLQKPATDVRLAGWIAKVFQNYENDTINFDMFKSAFLNAYPESTENDATGCWSALVNTQYETGKSRYSVEKLLEGILRNGRSKDLFITSNTDTPITISNIHRAKGREFDSVLILKDVLESQENSSDELLEHKVKYVAVTRPRKFLSEIEMKPQFIYIDRTGGRRCFQGNFSRTGRKYLTHIETGFPGDIDVYSFAESTERQNYIRDILKPGMRVKLIRCSEFEAWVKYRIVLEDNENTVLGYTTREFASALNRALKRILDISYDVFPHLYPNILGDIYVENIISCIAANKASLKGARSYGNISIWTGFALSGFAQYEKDIY